jgi:hypothetical protein
LSKRDDGRGGWENSTTRGVRILRIRQDKMIQLKRMGRIGHVGGIGNAYRILVERQTVETTEHTRRCADNIKMNHRATEWDVMDCNHLDPDRSRWNALVNAVMNIWVSYSICKLLS